MVCDWFVGAPAHRKPLLPRPNRPHEAVGVLPEGHRLQCVLLVGLVKPVLARNRLPIKQDGERRERREAAAEERREERGGRREKARRGESGEMREER